MKKTGVILLLVCSLQGCSRAPSQGDIEAAVAGSLSRYRVEECKGISIENVTKKNGVKIDDSTYQIQASYDVRVIPVDGFREKMDELRAEKDNIEAEKKRMEGEIQQSLKEEGGDDSFSNVYYVTSRPELASARTRPLFDKNREIGDRLFKTQLELEKQTKAVRNAWGPDYCVLITGTGAGVSLFGFKDLTEVLMTGGTNGFEVTLNMIKTDNGWMLAN